MHFTHQFQAISTFYQLLRHLLSNYHPLFQFLAPFCEARRISQPFGALVRPYKTTSFGCFIPFGAVGPAPNTFPVRFSAPACARRAPPARFIARPRHVSKKRAFNLYEIQIKPPIFIKKYNGMNLFYL